jgi:hypothetical protein
MLLPLGNTIIIGSVTTKISSRASVIGGSGGRLGLDAIAHHIIKLMGVR